MRLNAPDAVATLGDLPWDLLAGLRGLQLPRIGVLGNHDAYSLDEFGVRDLHLRPVELGGLSLTGFEGCVRYSGGPRQYTQHEAEHLVGRLPAADVLLCHSPPAGVNDEPDDPAHVGFVALRSWVERQRAAPAAARSHHAGPPAPNQPGGRDGRGVGARPRIVTL